MPGLIVQKNRNDKRATASRGRATHMKKRHHPVFSVCTLLLATSLKSLSQEIGCGGGVLAKQWSYGLTRAGFTDDLDDLIRRRVIRVLVSYNKTDFFYPEMGQPRGF